MTPALTEPLRDHHKHCDELFAAAESSVAAADWAQAASLFGEFAAALENHFHTEETVLFPAFETATGMSGGPTQVMRYEHAQMRDLCAQMAEALAARSAEGFSGAAETLLILMQQHNMKEENILYPMCDRALDRTGSALAPAIATGLQVAAVP